MNKELRLIKEEFCRLQGLSLDCSAKVEFQGWNLETRNPTFMVYPEGERGVFYEHQRLDLTPYTQVTGLSLEAELKYQRDSINKDMLADWFSRVTGIVMLPSDIGQVLFAEVVTVVASSNSMRFKQTFSMAFK